MITNWKSEYFYGNKISDYGLANKRIDYATLAKAFDAVLNNEIMQKTVDIGYWDQESGFVDYSDELMEIDDKIDDLQEQHDTIADTDYENEQTKADLIEDLEAKITILEDKKSDLEAAQDEQPEIYQYYIVSDQGARILEEDFNEIVFYNSELDMYVWGVTHYGTSWDYVLTDVKIEL